MTQTQPTLDVRFNQVERYNAFLEVMHARMTNRAFVPDYVVPIEHYEMIMEAARLAPSGADTQPWHYIIVTDPDVKARLAERFVQEQNRRARLGMKFPTPNYRGMASAPGLIVVVADFRLTRAFPVLNDGSELDRRYYLNAERILLQSVAASVMCAHLAAAALGYAVWWVSAIGQEEIQTEFKPLLGVPDQLAVLDIFCFGPPLKPSYRRWKKSREEIMNWDRFDMSHFMTDEQLDEWIKTERAKVMYRDESKID
jgi:nitroreductase